MRTDIPTAHLQYFLQDEIYLLKTDRGAYHDPAGQPELTKESVIAITAQTPVTSFKYFGGNQKNFLVLCNYSNAEFMADAHFAALISTVTRINYSQQDMAIVNLYNYPEATWQQLNSYFAPQKLLILGREAVPLNNPPLKQNEIQTIGNSQALYTFSFEEMMGNKENTKAFWTQIKTF